MRPDGISIKWKLLRYLALFTTAMLAFLWIFQTMLLDSFYKAIKTQAIKSAAHTIVENINSQDLQTLVDKIAQQNEINIRLVDNTGKDLYSSMAVADSVIHRAAGKELKRYYDAASNNNGTYFESVAHDFSKGGPYDAHRFSGNVPNARDDKQGLVYIRIVDMPGSPGALLMLNSTITPVNTTADTLRVQLIFVTVLMLLLSVILALYISKRISAPIIKINDSAKQLARGNFETTFDGGGYREISELNHTLNFAAGELSKTEALRRELIANISHDLRTPLTLITGYAEVMRDLPGENTPGNVQVIIDEARRLSGLVSDVLDISRLQSGTQQPVMTRFNLSGSIRNMLTRYAKFTSQEGYRITFAYDSDVFVEADELRISQVLYNLINNALTYTGPDKTVAVRQKVSGGQVRIEVSDTGEGIAPEKLPYIWDRYYKIDKAHKRASIGTGLGLSIVKSILELHKARFGVESKPGSGSTFWFELKTVLAPEPGHPVH